MRLILVSLLITLSLTRPSIAQEGGEDGLPAVPDVTYPELVKSGASLEEFIPDGWKLERQAIGDLNNDKRADVLFVLQMTDPRNIINNEGGLGEQTFDSNPRLLGVIFKRDNDFILGLANHSLIPRRIDPVFDDVLGEDGSVEIQGRSIVVMLHSFASAGTWSAGNTTFKFRFQKGAFRLIGWDTTSIHRGSGEISETSINFLTGDVVEGKGSIESDELKTTRRKIPRRQLLTIDEVGDGMMFQPQM